VQAQTVLLSPTTLNFGNVAFGSTSATRKVTLTNTGSVALSITSIVASANFVETNTCRSSLSAGAKCTISVAFSPTATGAYSGTLTITCNGSSSPQTVSLSGTGSSAGTFSGRSTHDLTQSVTWSSTSATVATISNVVGTQGLATASAAGTTTIEAVKGKISGLTLLTVNPSLLSITLTPATSSIALGTRQQFTATGNYGDGSTQILTHSVTWTSDGASATVTSTGLATAAQLGSAHVIATSGSISSSAVLISILTGSITALPPGLYFPPTPSGTISTILQTATIYNLGSTNATITGVALTGSSSFQLISGTYPVKLAPGAYASFTFSFSPGTTGSITGTAMTRLRPKQLR